MLGDTAGRDQGNVKGVPQTAPICAHEMKRKGRADPLAVAQSHASMDSPACGNVLGNLEIQLEARKPKAADESRDQHGREKRGEQQKEQIVSRRKSRQSNKGYSDGEIEAQLCDLLAHAALERSADLLPPLLHFSIVARGAMQTSPANLTIGDANHRRKRPNCGSAAEP